jgi:hypothetical protein
MGQVSREESFTEFRLGGHLDGSNGTFADVMTETSEHERKRSEILGTFDHVVTKKKVRYELLEKHETRDGKPQPDIVNPLAGHTYIAELKASKLVFTTEEGGPVSDAESRELFKRLGTVGKPDPFLEGLPDGALRPNQPAPTLRTGILELLDGADGESDLAKLDIRFVGTRDHAEGKCGVFRFSMEVQMAGEPRLRMDLDGEYLVRISDGAAVELDLHGPARMTGRQVIEGVDVKLDGTGEMRGLWRTAYNNQHPVSGPPSR